MIQVLVSIYKTTFHVVQISYLKQTDTVYFPVLVPLGPHCINGRILTHESLLHRTGVFETFNPL